MKKAALFILFFVAAFFGQGLDAQEAGGKSAAYAEIVFFEGDDLLVLRANGKVADEEPLGQRLLQGDQVQTGAKTQVELVLMPRRSRIRLSENTAVTIRDLGSDGSTALELLYGRLRSKVTKLASGSAPYTVSSQSCVAGVRGTDFGCDVLVSRSGIASGAAGAASSGAILPILAPTRVYCFEGSVAVDPSLALKAQAVEKGAANAESAAAPEAMPAEKVESVVISAGTMALVEAPSAAKAATIVQQPIETELSSYWKANDFTSAEPMAISEALRATPEPVPAPSAAPAGAALSAAPAAPEIDWAPIRARLDVKNSAIVGALTFFLGGAALWGYSFWLRPSDSTLADSLLNAGAFCALAGLPVLVFAISVDPLKGVGK
jgi:hypothetical protein